MGVANEILWHEQHLRNIAEKGIIPRNSKSNLMRARALVSDHGW